MAKTLVFSVQGSEEDPYEVSITRSGDNLTATCTCRAATFGRHCKHRVGILTGDVGKLKILMPEDPSTAVSEAIEMTKGSDVEEAIRRVKIAAEEERLAREDHKEAKEDLAAALTD